MRNIPVAGFLLMSLTAAQAAPPSPVVVELFTSQGCSSCPPADAVLRDLAKQRPDVLALGFHVDYWDRLGWRDPFSSAEATARQRRYVSALALETSYTPQMIVDGRTDLVGSNRSGAMAAIAAASATRPAGPSLTLDRAGDTVTVRVGAAAARGAATVLLVGYDPTQTTAIGRGENSGLRSVEANVVRGLANAGEWRGVPLSVSSRAPAGEKVAVLLQTADGHILAAARLDP